MRIELVVFVLGVAACSSYERCPAYNELLPCDCENMEDSGKIHVSCVDEGDNLKLEDLRESMKSLAGKRNVEIDLDGIDLGKIPSDFFKGIGVTRLDISYCKLESLTGDANKPVLSGLEDSLEELMIVSTFEENVNITNLRLGHLRNLRYLDLSNNAIREVSDDLFDMGPLSLEFVVLDNNGIEKLGRRALAQLSNLKELSIIGNRFGFLERSMFPNSANNLYSLELDNNAFTNLPEDVFSNMPILSSVSFRNNGLARLERNTWEPVWEQLDAIYLEGNPLECDSQMDWMFNLRVTSAIYGTCFSPKHKKGTSLQDFIDNKG